MLITGHTLPDASVNRARRACIHRASRFARVDVAPVTSIVREGDIGKSFLIRHVVGIHAIAETIVRGDIEPVNEYSTSYHARGNVRNVIRNTPSVRESCQIAGQHAEPSAARLWCGWNPGVQPQ